MCLGGLHAPERVATESEDSGGDGMCQSMSPLTKPFRVYLDLSILSAGGQHLRVSAEAHTQHGVIHHHEVVLSLVLQILSDTIIKSAGVILNANTVPLFYLPF